jgi:hypothetical protein
MHPIPLVWLKGDELSPYDMPELPHVPFMFNPAARLLHLVWFFNKHGFFQILNFDI